MSEQANKGYNTTMNLITTLSQLPLVRVNREEFLKNTFKKSEHLDRILAEGPQAVFTSDSLRKKANEIFRPVPILPLSPPLWPVYRAILRWRLRLAGQI